MGGLTLRLEALLPVLALLGVAGSGCLGGGSEGVREEPLAATGTLRGTVFSDASLPLPNARVSLVRTDLFVVTGREGTFLLPNVTVGVHTLRVEASGFQVLENETVVTAGNTTEERLFLVPDSDTGAGYRPHAHDLWLGRDEVTIMDHEQDFNQPPRYAGIGGPAYYRATSAVLHPNRNTTDGDMLVRIPESGSDPAIIFPGTKEVRVTISWDSTDGSMSKVLLKYTPLTGGEKRILSRLPSGGTWRIQVGPGEADTGHQLYSLWSFWVNPAQDPFVDGTSYRPGLLLAPIHIKIVLVRGELYSEVAHEDFWGGKDELVVVDHDRLRDCNSAYRVVERETNPCLVDSGIKPVPPGTIKLRVELKWTYTQADGVNPSDLVLIWRTAAQNRLTTQTSQFHSGASQPTGPQSRLTEITVKQGETDAFYQKYSLWAFGYAVKGHEKDAEIDYEPRSIKMSVKVTAIRDPSFDAGSA